MKRLYYQLIQEHFQELRQMVFLAGPRQVGKTTACLEFGKKMKDFYYLNWDDDQVRKLILSGTSNLIHETKILEVRKRKPLLIFDEIHKYSRWKQFLKGFFDVYGQYCHILVTGSAKLNLYQRSGDSLMGRYFLYRMHPLSIGELVRPQVENKLTRAPKRLSKNKIDQLIEFGGFPEPFLKSNPRFSKNWQRLRFEQLIKEDIRDLSQIHELSQLEMLALILTENAGKQFSQSSLANQLNVSIPTIKRWLTTLETFYYCFHIRPWTKNIKRSLRKEPKFYLWDWSLVDDIGARLENFVAVHLLKASHFWTDYGLGNFELFYLRDKEKREVDFIMSKNGIPWFLVEVKTNNQKGISKSLYYFQEQTKAQHAFQVCFLMDYIEKNCFEYKKPVIVPASTFLSQLV